MVRSSGGRSFQRRGAVMDIELMSLNHIQCHTKDTNSVFEMPGHILTCS